jgi:hypothetical protein
MKVERSTDSLVIQTGPAGFNETSAFPLLFGGLFTLLGVLCLVSAATTSSVQSLVLALPALLLGMWVGRIGLSLALRRHRVELSRDRLRIASWGGGKTTVVECPLREARVTLRRGRAWEVGLLPQLHQWEKIFPRLSIDCAGRQLFLLDGAPERQKEEAHQLIQQWLN